MLGKGILDEELHTFNTKERLFIKTNTLKQGRGSNQGYTAPRKAKILMKDKQFYARKDILMKDENQQIKIESIGRRKLLKDNFWPQRLHLKLYYHESQRAPQNDKLLNVT